MVNAPEFAVLVPPTLLILVLWLLFPPTEALKKSRIAFPDVQKNRMPLFAKVAGIPDDIKLAGDWPTTKFSLFWIFVLTAVDEPRDKVVVIGDINDT